MEKRKLLDKFITIILIISLTIGNWFVFGKWCISIATTNEVEIQTSETNNKNVKFDIGIKNSDDNLEHKVETDINDTIKLTSYLSLEDEGYLKNIHIKFSGENEETKNFDIIDTNQGELDIIKEFSSNEIELKQIGENESINLEFEIKWNNELKNNISKLNQNNIIELTAIYVDVNGNENNIKKEITINIAWKCDNEIILESNISRYADYELEEEKGIVLTQKINLKQNEEEGLPYKNIEIILEKLKIEDKTTENIIVKEGNIDIPYETIDDNKIKIIDENKVEKEIIQNTNTIKEYEITYIFKDIELPDNIDIDTNIEAKAQIFGSEEKNIQITYNEHLEETKGEIVSINNEKIQSISKGRMYANFNSTEPTYETNYNVIMNLEIAYKNQINNIKIQDNGTYFEDEEMNEYEAKTYYKSTKINKQNFEEILGEEGSIKILDINGTEIAQINKSTQIDENGNYYVEYQEKIDKINIVTSEILNIGKLKIQNEKSMLSNISYAKKEIQKFRTLNDKYKLEIIIGENDKSIELEPAKITRELTETKTEAEISLNINKLSSISKNENVEIKIELKNNNENSDLYKNPEFEIELPKEISNIEIKDTNILFDEELQIESVEQTKNAGKIILKIKLKGTQSKFLLEEYINGTTIVLNTDIEVDTKTISKTEKITMKYYNQNSISYNEEKYGISVNEIEFISPVGMIIGTEISNYNKDEKNIMSIAQGEKTGKLEIYTEAKDVQANILVMNNTGDVCDNLAILGRIPTKESKNIITGEDLGTNINTKLTNDILVEGKENIEIYYSDNGMANQDLSIPENNWNKDKTKLDNVKSYMIKINDKIEQSDIINIKYNFEIPANLEHNSYIYTETVAFFNNNLNVEETSIADRICLSTGRGPQMEISQSASVENGEEVNEGQKIEYTITVKNTGLDSIYDLEIKDILPENSTYYVYTRNGLSVGYDEKTPNAQMLLWQIKEVAIGETVKVKFNVEVNKLPSIEEYYSNYENFVEQDGKYYLKEDENLTEITNIPTIYIRNGVNVNAKELGKEIVGENYENIVKSPEIILTEEASIAEEVLIREDSELIYSIRIKNNKQEDINNLKIKKELPEGLEFKEIYTIKYNEEYEEWEKQIIGSYNEETRTAELDIEKLKQDENIHIKIETKTSKLQEEEYNREIETITKIAGDNISGYIGNVKRNTIAKPKLETEYICNNNNKYITDGEIVNYSIKVTNVSNISANNVEISDILPEELELINADYSIGEFNVTTTMDKNRKIEATGNISPNETMELNIKAKAVSKSQNISIENTPTINSQELGSSQEKAVKHIVEKNVEESSIVVEKEERKYSISGKTWYDENKNGTRDIGEDNLAGMEIKIVNAENGETVQNIITDAEGNYYANNLAKGNYLVICKYDDSKYQVTEYKKVGVSDNLNSDAIEMKSDNENYTSAITDTIRIDNKDYENIDIGFTDKLKFDISLDSAITKITLQNDGEIKEYNYDNKKLAKLEINPDLLSSSVVYVEYKIIVKNEGNVAGVVRSIVDYMPKDMIFNSELNTNWYIGSDNNIYTNILSNEVLNPGETKEIKLTLIKKMTEENTGINVNKIEISETYNELGLEDIDSKENNKSDTEDDYSQTTALIGVETGKTIINNTIILIITIIGLLAVIYYIKKHNIIKTKQSKKIYK